MHAFTGDADILRVVQKYIRAAVSLTVLSFMFNFLFCIFPWLIFCSIHSLFNGISAC